MSSYLDWQLLGTQQMQSMQINRAINTFRALYLILKFSVLKCYSGIIETNVRFILIFDTIGHYLLNANQTYNHWPIGA